MAAPAAAASGFSAWVRSPTGPKTTHFWGPVANWGLVGAGMLDSQKPADQISITMTGVLCGYSLLFMRFAYMVTPRNYLLMSVHVCNEGVQAWQLTRAVRHQQGVAAAQAAAAAGGAPVALA